MKMKKQNIQLNNIGIIGSGRFTETLLRFFGGDFSIKVFGRNTKEVKKLSIKYHVGACKDMSEIATCDVVIFAVPISAFESVLTDYSKIAAPNQLLIDILSVKVLPEKVFKKVFENKKQNFIFTHPMFGPDSSKDGFNSLPIMMDGEFCNQSLFEAWSNYFKSKGLNVIEMSCDEHDRLAANSQGLVHLLGRVLDELKIAPTLIDTLGTKKLLEVRDQTCNDTFQLFLDLQRFNPYTKKMRKNAINSLQKIIKKI